MALTKRNNKYKNNNKYKKTIKQRGGLSADLTSQFTVDSVNIFNSLPLWWKIKTDSSIYHALNVPINATNEEIDLAYDIISDEILDARSSALNQIELTILRRQLNRKKDDLKNKSERKEYDKWLSQSSSASRQNPPQVPIRENADVTFIGTQVPNNTTSQKTKIANSQMIIELLITLNENKQQFKNMAEDMRESKESGNLENYVLFEQLLENEQIMELLNILYVKLRKPINHLFANALNPGQDYGKINPRYFFSLMILSSRLGSKSESALFESLRAIIYGDEPSASMDDDNKAHFYEKRINVAFKHFLMTNSALNQKYVETLLNGDRIYEIYVKNSSGGAVKMAKKEILERFDKWLKHAPPNNEIISFPESYIFKKYTTSEKKRMNNDVSICNTIAALADEMGQSTSPEFGLKKSVFDIRKDDSSFLTKIAPAAVKKRIAKKLARPISLSRPKK